MPCSTVLRLLVHSELYARVPSIQKLARQGNMKWSSLNVDECIETLKSGECVSERSLKLLCSYVSELLMEESNVQPVLSPVTIVGDLHGQFFDLLQLLEVGGWPPDTSYIFLGDFVDRGHNSVETLSLLLCLKLKYPGHVTLLRGNHEVRSYYYDGTQSDIASC